MLKARMGLGDAAGLVMQRGTFKQETSMAGDQAGKPGYSTAPGNDYPAHERDYSGFIKLFKYGAIASFIVAMIVIYIISN